MQNLIFILMVGAAVGILVMALALPVFGESRQARKRLRRRLRQVATDAGEPESVSLLRERYLKRLSPLERSLEALPGMERIARLLRDAGSQWIAYRYVSMAVALGVAAAVVGSILTDSGLLALLFGGLALAAPFFKLLSDRARRLARFEEQLPDAIDVMRRALQAGHPFSETLHLVATELPDPVAVEFERTFNDINYGGDMRTALVGLLERVPTVTVMALVTSIMVQKETGGNLAEILEKISRVIRGRFRFQRHVRTLSAEGRMSAWVLVLIPFAMFLLLSFVQPDYLPVLTENEAGRKLIAWSFGLMIVGIVWIRHIIRIRV
ncbi:type II secretion system F family protein [Marinimicrobium sp. C2-29]|uniref:type II secretion system F family protein n=1 Tax=Marinimicrobium sp. C2-29 TaxID=3139825 RepID=UPI003138D4D2